MTLGMGRYGSVFLLQGGDFQRPWKRCSIIAKWPLEIEIAMGILPVPISVSRGLNFYLGGAIYVPRYGYAYHSCSTSVLDLVPYCVRGAPAGSLYRRP